MITLISNPGFWAGVAGVVTALGALLKVFKTSANVSVTNSVLQQHLNDTAAHNAPGTPATYRTPDPRAQIPGGFHP